METVVKIVADGLMLPLGLTAVYMFLFKIPASQKFEVYKRFLLAGLIAYASAKILAQIYQPETLRPFQKLGVDPGAAYLNNPGFPSDHALFAVFLVLMVWVSTKNLSITIAMVVLAFLICVGRVLALVHTPLDVIGGVAVAFMSLLAFWGYKQTKTNIAKKNKLRV